MVAFSDYDYHTTEEHPEEGATLFRIRGKPGVLKRNLLVIPCLTLMVMLTGVDVM